MAQQQQHQDMERRWSEWNREREDLEWRVAEREEELEAAEQAEEGDQNQAEEEYCRRPVQSNLMPVCSVVLNSPRRPAFQDNYRPDLSFEACSESISAIDQELAALDRWREKRLEEFDANNRNSRYHSREFMTENTRQYEADNQHWMAEHDRLHELRRNHVSRQKEAVEERGHEAMIAAAFGGERGGKIIAEWRQRRGE